MGTLQPFTSVTERSQLTQAELTKLKKELADLHAEFVQKTGVSHGEVRLASLQRIEQKICSLEHVLAHAEIIYEEQPIPDTFATLHSYMTELRFTLMGIRLKIMHKINPKKYALTQHSVTYHLKK